MTNTNKLIAALANHAEVITGKVSLGKDGIAYRYDKYVLKYNSAANWLVNLFEKAAIENGKKNATQFNVNETYSFFYERPKYKGQANGKMSYTILITL